MPRARLSPVLVCPLPFAPSCRQAGHGASVLRCLPGEGQEQAVLRKEVFAVRGLKCKFGVWPELKPKKKKKATPKPPVITGNIFTPRKINRAGEEFKSPSFLNSNLIANNPAPECKGNILPWRIVVKFKGGQTTKRSKIKQMAFCDGVQKIRSDLSSLPVPTLLPYHQILYISPLLFILQLK